MRGRQQKGQTIRPYLETAGEQVNNAQSGGINLNQLNRSIIFSHKGVRIVQAVDEI
jgi:hypothetical protein